MNTALWIVAGVLAAAFAAAGMMKLTTPRLKLAEKMPYAAHRTDGQMKLIGAVEVAGALGLILPAVTDIAPVLVPIAAIGLAVTMALAVAVHKQLREPLVAAMPAIVLGLLSVFVAWGRLGSYAF